MRLFRKDNGTTGSLTIPFQIYSPIKVIRKSFSSKEKA